MGPASPGESTPLCSPQRQARKNGCETQTACGGELDPLCEVARHVLPEVAVADHGPGLAQADASRLFQTSFTTKKDGMGFGLSIVRAIVEMHGGRVTYEPNRPHGAIFRVWLPAIGT